MPATGLAARVATRVFTAKALRPVLAHGENTDLRETVGTLRSGLGLPSGSNNGDVVEAAYALLASSYRSEYVYKNLIASKIFVGRHRAANSAILNEFRVGSAVADSLFVNGHATVYEIKTELDNPDKLKHQLAEYYRAFPLVNVVVHESSLDRYERLLSGTPVGLISVGTRWKLSTVFPAVEHASHLCVRTMVNALRVEEMQCVLTSLGFDLPDVPNGLRFARYLDIALEVGPSRFHDAFRTVLKQRRALSGDLRLHRDPQLFPLRALLAQLDPGPTEGENLYRWLSTGE